MTTIAFASGKGGTGKTTLTAAFAHLASREHRTVVADADVEASNLPLALHVRASSCTGYSGGAGARIDSAACTTCGACAEVCRFHAIDAGTSAYAVDSTACEGCGRCVRVCPSDAIVMEPRTVGEACTGTSVVGPAVYGQLGPGEDLSGRLVTEVRRLAAQAVEDHEADLLLIDGPPGIGCPLIAAVTNTDLLVAVAEPSLSGAHDLDRLARLAARLDVPVAVVLNKADLAEQGAEAIRALCEELSLPLLAEIPFSPELAGLLQTMAREADEYHVGPAPLGALVNAWTAIKEQAGVLR